MGLSPNPEVLSWAIDRCGKTPNDFVSSFPKLIAWLEGAWKPTLKQLEDFASKTHVSLASLFADDTPALGLQIADFRIIQVNGQASPAQPSPELFDTIDQMRLRQDWMRSFFSEEGYPLVPFVGQYEKVDATKTQINEIANDMHEILNLPSNWAASPKSHGDALKVFKDAIERSGVSVVINGIVNDNTHRALFVEEFRGFVLADRIAPLVFVNGRDAKAAQIFTLAHEVAHLYFSQTGVISSDVENIELETLENICDAVAAEFLVPSISFLSYWKGENNGEFNAIKSAAKTFKVSFIVCARKAKELGLITKGEFFAYYRQHKMETFTVPENVKKKPGGDYYRNKQYRLGNVFGEAVFVAVQSQQLSYGEAYRLTGLNAGTFDSYFKGAQE